MWWLFLATNVTASGILAIFVLRWRYLLLKPSILFIAYYQLSVMWPALTWHSYLIDLVPNVREYFVALHIFGLLGTVISVCTWHGTARYLKNRILQRPSTADRVGWLTFAVLASVLLFVAVWYLRTVGWHNTGLDAILTKAERTAEMREEALKLIPSALLRYGWMLATCAVAYLLAYFLALEGIRALRQQRFLRAGVMGLSYGGVLVLVMLPGARAPAALVVLTTLFAYYVATGFRLSPTIFVLLAALGLVVPSILSLLREQQELTMQNLAIYYLDIFDRVAGRSVQDNIWLVSYVQEHGFFGGAGVPIVARLMNLEPVNIFNVVGLYFVPLGLESTSANASFPAVNYACFGPWALALSLLLTFLMDGLLVMQSGLPRRLLIPSCGICAIISMNFAMTMFTTVFLTHGLVFTIGTCYLLHFGTRLLQGGRTAPSAGGGAAAIK